MFAQEVDGDRTVVAMNDELPYSMASTAKIVTSLDALELLVVGGGNAQLTSAELRAWFGRMQAQGLREIDGDTVLERFAFQLRPADPAGTPAQSAGEPRHVWPDALTLDEGLLGVTVQPSRARAGACAAPAPRWTPWP